MNKENLKEIFNDIPEEVIKVVKDSGFFINENTYEEFTEKIMKSEDYESYLQMAKYYEDKSKEK